MSPGAFTDLLWAELAPLMPPEPPKPNGGRPRVSDRACLNGIVFVLRSGIPWSMLPAEFGCGSGVTCWRRFSEWTRLGLWDELHKRMLRRLSRLGELDWSRAVIDSASFRAVFGGCTQAPTPQTELNLAASATL